MAFMKKISSLKNVIVMSIFIQQWYPWYKVLYEYDKWVLQKCWKFSSTPLQNFM